MGYLVLARKWRPQTFEEVVGQEHVTTTLANAIKAERVGHAYLFTGPRGVGKTTTARILARALNCESGPTPQPCGKCDACRSISVGSNLDVLEIDGASNRGIDDVRELREQVRYAPSEGRYKVYIIDEVHMLTDQAFNALLKTLEEPPAHVVFVFATTSPQKIPMTILSRCQRFDFNLISAERILQRLKAIAKKEKFKIDDAAIALLARKGRGSVRDAESLLDQVTSAAEGAIDEDCVRELLGIGRSDLYFDLCGHINKSDAGSALKDADSALRAGLDIGEFMSGLVEHLRALFLLSLDPGLEDALDLPASELSRYREQAALFKQKEILRLLQIASEAAGVMRRSEDPRFHAEVALARMADAGTEEGLSDIVRRLEELEARLASAAAGAEDGGSQGKTPAKRALTGGARSSTAGAGRGKTRRQAISDSDSGVDEAGNSATAGCTFVSGVGATGVGAAGTGPKTPSVDGAATAASPAPVEQPDGSAGPAGAGSGQDAGHGRLEVRAAAHATGKEAGIAAGGLTASAVEPTRDAVLADGSALLTSDDAAPMVTGSLTASAAEDMTGQALGEHRREAMPTEEIEAHEGQEALTKEQLDGLWSEVVKKVTEKKTYLGNFLSVAVPVEARGENLALGFPAAFSFHKEQVSAHSNKRLVQEATQGVFGRFLKLRFLTIEDGASERIAGPRRTGSGLDNGGTDAAGGPPGHQSPIDWRNAGAVSQARAVDEIGVGAGALGLVGAPKASEGMTKDPHTGSALTAGAGRSQEEIVPRERPLQASASAVGKLDESLRMVLEYFDGEIVDEPGMPGGG